MISVAALNLTLPFVIDITIKDISWRNMKDLSECISSEMLLTDGSYSNIPCCSHTQWGSHTKVQLGFCTLLTSVGSVLTLPCIRFSFFEIC